MMKKLLVILIAAIMSCSAIQAQEVQSEHWREGRNTLSISAGYTSGFFYGKTIIFAWIPAAAEHAKNWKYYGAYGLQYMYQVNWWFRTGVKATWEMDRYDIYSSNKADGVKTGVSSNHTLSLGATMQFTYFNRPHVQLYSGLDLCAGLYMTHSSYEDKSKQPVTRLSWFPALGITPLGVAFGSWKCFGFIETNIGVEAIIKAGLGVHF